MQKTAFAAVFCSLLLTACGAAEEQPRTDPVTEAQAKSVVQDFAGALESLNLATVDKWYADDIVAFDAGDPDRISGKVSMHVANARFLDMKFDDVEMPDPRIQILGPDMFIASGTSRFSSSTGKVKEADIRYTEVFRRQSDGSWKSVHEHIDFVPDK